MIFPYSSAKSISRYQASVKRDRFKKSKVKYQSGFKPYNSVSGTADMGFNIRDYV